MKGFLFADVTGNKLGHLKHADLGLAAKDCLEFVVGIDLGPLGFILKIVFLDINPELLGKLRAGERRGADNGGEQGVRRDRGHEFSIRFTS